MIYPTSIILFILINSKSLKLVRSIQCPARWCPGGDGYISSHSKTGFYVQAQDPVSLAMVLETDQMGCVWG